MDTGGINPMTTVTSGNRALGLTFANAIVGYGPQTVTAAEYNLNRNTRFGVGHANETQVLGDEMKTFLSGMDRWIQDKETAKELMTVAENWGRRGSAVKMRTFIINQIKDPNTSPHFRVLPLKALTDAELAGHSGTVLSFGYTPPQEAAEFQPPHYISFESELYESKGYRFNHGFRFNGEVIPTAGGPEMLGMLAARAANDFIILMEQIIMAALMHTNDRYAEKRLLWASGAKTQSELLQKYQYRGPFTGGSWLVSKTTVGILHKPNGWEYLCEWVNDTMKARTGAGPNAVFIPPGIQRDLAYDKDRIDYSKRGPLANEALMDGSDFTDRMIRNKIAGIEIITQPTYEMRDSRVEIDQALNHPLECGQYYLIGNDDYKKHNIVQASRGLDSSAPRYACGYNDLYFLDYSTDQVTKRCQGFAELMNAALCWDQDGNLNHQVYRFLEDEDWLQGFTEKYLEHRITDMSKFKPDPWIVESDGRFKRVSMVGNQDCYHTSIEDTEFAVHTAVNVLASKAGQKCCGHIDKLAKMMHENYQVSPDENGDLEAFWAAVAWQNVNHKTLDDNDPVYTLKRNYLPSLTGVYRANDAVGKKSAFIRDNPTSGHRKVLVKAPIIQTKVGPLFDVDLRHQVALSGNPQLTMLLGGFIYESPTEFFDLFSLLSIDTNRTNATDVDSARAILIAYSGIGFDSANSVLNDQIAADFNRRSTAAIRAFLPQRASVDVDITSPSGLTNTLTIYGVTAGMQTENGTIVFNASAAAFVKNLTDPQSVTDRIFGEQAKQLQYEEVRAVVSRRANITDLRRKAAAHPNLFWLSADLVNYQDRKLGFAIEDEFHPQISVDISRVNSAGEGTFFEDPVTDNHRFWQVKMGFYGIEMPLFSKEDLLRCRIATFSDANRKLPGFSNFESMRCVAYQMKKRSDFCGWQKPWMIEYFAKVIKYVDSANEFASLAFHTFSPFHSSQTRNQLDIGMIFQSSKLQHYIHHKKDREVAAQRLFTSMVLDGLARPMGMIQPFIDFPILWSGESLSLLNGTNVDRKHHFDCTLRLNDDAMIGALTPYVITSSLDSYMPAPQTMGAALFPRSLDYGHLGNTSRARQHRLNLLAHSVMAPSVHAAPGSNEQHMKNFFVDSVFEKIIASTDFGFTEYFDDRENSTHGFAAKTDAAGRVIGSKSKYFKSDFMAKVQSIIEDVYRKYHDEMKKDINAFYEAVCVAAETIKEFTVFIYEDQANPRDPDDFSLTKAQKQMIVARAKAKVSKHATQFEAERIPGVDGNPMFDAFMKRLHTGFVSDITAVSSLTRQNQYYVTNLGLSINGNYWREFDKRISSLYNLRTGEGVTLSLVRPQRKNSSRFLDVTVNDHSLSVQQKQLLYKELVNLGPGDRRGDDIMLMLSKNMDKSVTVVQKHQDHDEMLENLDVNQHFMSRYAAICKCWKTRAIGLAYLTATPTADLMINMHKMGIPTPMSLLCFDPYIILNMGSLLFVQGGSELGFLGHHLTLHTSGFNSDTRLTTNHMSMWLEPSIPMADKILQVPNAIFQGYIGGGSGRIVKTIAGTREKSSYTRYHDDTAQECDWNPARPFERRADRFVCYGGGSLTKADLSDDINIIGNNHAKAGNYSFGFDLPLGLIPTTPDNVLSYPSAIVFNFTTRYYQLNENVEPRFLNPASLRDIRQNNPSDQGGVWNVWCSSGKCWRPDPNTGEGTILREYGTSILSDINELDGPVLKGAPTAIYQNKMTSVK